MFGYIIIGILMAVLNHYIMKGIKPRKINTIKTSVYYNYN